MSSPSGPEREKAYEQSPLLKGRGAKPAEKAKEPATRDVETRVNLKVNDAHVQFARSSMRRAADREVREARWSSYADIGAA